MFKSNRGQLSIFLGITLVLVMGMLAFIINIGLFVKAKINLQNAVDAAAFSGAAVQARQLTNIAYLNWEMRNNYKEWLFKYYVLGELGSLKSGNNYPLNVSAASTSGTTNFTLKTGAASVAGMNISGMGGSGGPAQDKFNLGSICIHNSGETDICPSFVIPGLPRFPAIGVAGISEIHETFVTNLVEAKAKNCTVRSKDNFNAALVWAFGEGVATVPPGMPAILAAQRPGAWPKAVELAMRMRNLEMIVNLPPKGPITLKNAQDLTGGAGADFSLNERPYKAFMSAFKNLGGGKYKEDGRDELSREFKLTELEPNVHVVDRESLSGFLIPQNSVGELALKKYYLDLQAMPLNLATMFSTFTTTKSNLGPNLEAEGTCGISKTAMPVPGFILGFVKNPEVMTYYAVKGESKFIGLFSPFRGTSHESGVPLVAYAAAKPFGGRIGPKLFAFDPSNKMLQVRTDTNTGNRSLSHISGLQIPITSSGFNPGDPIPVSADFWIHNGVGAQAILGGIPSSVSAKPYFGIPNMIYDYENISQQSNSGGAATGQVVDIEARTGSGVNEKLGLYDIKQYNLLKNSLDPAIITILGSTASTGTYNSMHILNSIVRARRPTKYDAVNYLVPDFKHSTPDPTNAIPYITAGPLPSGATGNFITYKLFAPLMGDNLLFKNTADLENVLVSYIASMANAVNVYEQALLQVANSIQKLPTLTDVNNNNSNTAAAKGIHINVKKPIETPNSTNARPPLLDPGATGGCAPDIASKFHYFFSTDPAASVTKCSVEPLKVKMIKFINNIVTGDTTGTSRLYLISDYYTGATTDAINQDHLFTGYNPGHRQGVLARLVTSAISGGSVSGSMRNYYSTKFFRMAQITEGSPEAVGSLEASLREQVDLQPSDPEAQKKPKNLLKKADLTPETFFSYF